MGSGHVELTRSPLSSRHSKCLCIQVNSKKCCVTPKRTKRQVVRVISYAVFSNIIVCLQRTLTKRHLNLICDTFNAHQCKSNYRNDGNCAPAEVINEGQWQGKQV